MNLDFWERHNGSVFSEIISCWKTSTGANTDTRSIQAGNLFFALRGPNFDGNTFAERALQLGASGVIVDKSIKFKPLQNIFPVDDPLIALQCLARWQRRNQPCTVLGLTGSNGKTTTKELLARIFPDKDTVWATPGNLNNHIGLPLTLLRLQPQHRLVILEMGDNQTGDIALLCEIAEPDYGIITNIGKDHIGFLGTLEANAASKAELITALAPKKPFFLNLDDPNIATFCDSVPTITFATHQQLRRQADFWGELSINDPNGIQVAIEHKDYQWEFYTHLPGAYNLSNVLAAVAVGITLGANPESIQQGLSAYYPQNNRNQWITYKNKRVLLDAYNANPSSMEVAIKNFISYSQGLTPEPTLAFILGDMLELGEFSISEHQNLAALLNQVPLNSVIILIGNEIQATSNALTKKYYWFPTVEQAAPELPKLLDSVDMVLIKGSRGIALEKLVLTQKV